MFELLKYATSRKINLGDHSNNNALNTDETPDDEIEVFQKEMNNRRIQKENSKRSIPILKKGKGLRSDWNP